MNLIGQHNLLSQLYTAIDNGFPLFSVLVGCRGGGKKTIAHMIAQELNTTAIDVGISIADVRAMIVNSYKVKAPTTYIIADADKMSNEAKSALLKVTEEPPNHCYFIMTLENLSSMPSTIASRAAVYWQDRYLASELEEYANQIGMPAIVYNFCDTPGDIMLLQPDEVEKFIDYVQLVIDNIVEVSTANSLKIGERVALKEDAAGYDLKLFWKAFIYQCMQRAYDELPNQSAFDYAAGASLTSKYLAELSVRGVNKNMLFLDWILQLRKEWS